MISYTPNLSGGNYSNFQDQVRLAHSFANLILSLNEANEMIKTHPLWDILSILVLLVCPSKREPLQDAWDHWQVEVEIPDCIKDTLHGYVLAVNWLVRTIASTIRYAVTFGWKVNLKMDLWHRRQRSRFPPRNSRIRTNIYTYKPDFLPVEAYCKRILVWNHCIAY